MGKTPHQSGAKPMKDLPQEDLGSRSILVETESGESPMTTLVLSAGLKDAELEKSTPTPRTEKLAVDRPVDLPVVNHSVTDIPVKDLPVKDLDDHSLLEATRTGDEDAFYEIVRRYRNQITNYVYRILEDYDCAVDLAQETFVRVYNNVDRYQATYSFSTYIYKIAHNLAISEIRKRKRHRLIPLPFFFSDKDGEEVEIELPDQRLTQADDVIISDERNKAVKKAIGSLPEKYRGALVLCHLEEKSYEEISEILGLPVGTVKSRINRARNLLKEKLREYL
jgi:RNA polymerase sigma-70 factor, ECF subfamily